MCGIAGIIGLRGNKADRDSVARMTAAMEARGPDGQGQWTSPDGKLCLGHRRLSIVDLDPRSDQPLHSHDNRYSIVFNGEIYNYKILKKNLELNGHIFKTQSDTEVLIELFRIRGKSMLSDIRGMFAIAIWDNFTGCLLMARDPYGIKPLYYSQSNKDFRFASQVKALIAGGVTGSPDAAAIVGLHLFGSVPEPYTSLDTIRSVPAGHWLELNSEGLLEEGMYFSIADQLSSSFNDSGRFNGTNENLRDALFDSVKSHLVSDVPVGIFLSAGVDSPALLGLMREATSSEISAMTLAFREFDSTEDDESIIAAQVARHYGAKHEIYSISQSDFLNSLPKFFDSMDQPTVDGINTYFVSKGAQELGLRVAISGVGGDELFGGYPNFRNIPRDVARVRQLKLGRCNGRFSEISLPLRGRSSWFDPKIETLLRYGRSIEGAYLARRCVFTPQELSGVMDRDLAATGLARLEPLLLLERQAGSNLYNDHKHVTLLESTMYMRNQLLRDADWASMAHSIEVRVPLVDSFLLRELSARSMLGAYNPDKRELANAPSIPLPTAVTGRSKTGFSTPIGAWLQDAEMLSEWRKCRVLGPRNTKWAKRWVYSVSRQFFGEI